MSTGTEGDNIPSAIQPHLRPQVDIALTEDIDKKEAMKLADHQTKHGNKGTIQKMQADSRSKSQAIRSILESDKGNGEIVTIRAMSTVHPPPQVGKFQFSRYYPEGFIEGCRYACPKGVGDHLEEKGFALVL